MDDENGAKDASCSHESAVSPDHHSLMGINIGESGSQEHHTSGSNAHNDFKWSEPSSSLYQETSQEDYKEDNTFNTEKNNYDFHECNNNANAFQEVEEEMLFTQAPPSENDDDESIYDDDNEEDITPPRHERNAAKDNSTLQFESTVNNEMHSSSSPSPSSIEVKESKIEFSLQKKETNEQNVNHDSSHPNDKMLENKQSDPLIMSMEDTHSQNERMEYSEAPTVVIDDISPFKPSLETNRNTWIQSHHQDNIHSQASGFTEMDHQQNTHLNKVHDAESVSNHNHEKKKTINRTLDFDKALSVGFTDTESIHEEMIDTEENNELDQNSNLDTDCFMTQQAMDHSFQDADLDSNADVEHDVEAERSIRDNDGNDPSATFIESTTDMHNLISTDRTSKESPSARNANETGNSQVVQGIDFNEMKQKTCEQEDSMVSIFNGDTQSFPTQLQSHSPKVASSSPQSRLEQLPNSPESAAKTGYTYDSNIGTTTQFLNIDLDIGSVNHPETAKIETSKNRDDESNTGSREVLDETYHKERVDCPHFNENNTESAKIVVDESNESPFNESIQNAQVQDDGLVKGVHVLDPTPTPLHDTLSYPQENHSESNAGDNKSPFQPQTKDHTQESVGPTPISQILLEPKKSGGFSLEVANKVNIKSSTSNSNNLDEIDDSSDDDDHINAENKKAEDKDIAHDRLENEASAVQSDGEETHMETSKQKSKAIDTGFIGNKNDIGESDEDESDLQDTQESDNIPIAALRRIRRGVLKSDEGESEDEKEKESEIEWNESDDSDDDAFASQFTEEVKFQLDKFASYNVKEITSNLLQTPLAENTKLKRQVKTLSSEKKQLEARNTILTKANHDLSKKLSATSEQLKNKNALCAEMKTKLDELQPLLEALQQVGGLQLGNFQKNKSTMKTPKKHSDAKHDQKSPRKVLNFATPVTPKDDVVKVRNMVSASSKKVKRKPKIRGNTTFNDLWEILQEHGWTYRQGPEPYNMVYQPPFGSVKSGSILGKDFFEPDELLWKYAASMGYIDDGEPQSQNVNYFSNEENHSDSEDEVSQVKVISSKKTPDSGDTLSQDSNIEEWDNTKLVGQLGILTEMSRYTCCRLIQSFLSGSSGGGFMATLWKPLWDCIKDEQARVHKNLGWSYCKSIGAGELGRSHWFSPPCSVKRAKGIEGKDYFTTEEAALSYIIRDLKSSQDLKQFLDQKDLELLEIKLSRAIEQHVSFDEVGDASGPKSTRGQRRKEVSSSSEKPRRIKKKYNFDIDSGNDVKKTTFEKSEQDPQRTLPRSPTLKVSNVTSDLSQRTKEGAEILAGLNNIPKPNKNFAPYHSIATKRGIENVLKMRHPGSEKKRKKKDQSDATSPSKRLKTSPQPTFHCTQDPSDISPLLKSSTKKPLKADGSSTLPLSNLIFFGSGLDDAVPKSIEHLGGDFKRDIGAEDLKRSNISRKLFFLSTPDKRRTHKYFLAVALGVPMLHIDWLHKVAEEYRQYKENGFNGSIPTAFNSENYSRYRLPLGLSNSTGTFVLQKPGHANKWLGPSDMLKGLSISIVVTDPNLEAKWSDIIRACGAHVVNSTHVDRKDVTLDIALVDPVCFPPQSTAVPSRVSSTLNKIKNFQQNTKVLDLAWVTNSLVLRQPVEISDRYLIEWAGRGTNVSSPIDTRGSNHKEIYSIKVNRFNKGYARYEVGDSVMFGKPDHLSYGRIESIYNDRIKRKNFVTIKILELHNKTDLMDGGSNPCMVTIDEMDLYGHVILLREKDFEIVEWRHDRNVFKQRKSH